MTTAESSSSSPVVPKQTRAESPLSCQRLLPPRSLAKGEGRPEVRTPTRLILVRHAQSGNKVLVPGQRASANPGLSDLGYEQAEALGDRLAHEFGPMLSRQTGSLLIVSSPMRRCLLTMLPVVRQLSLTSDSCLCHGACFEFGCAGKAYKGSAIDIVRSEFPEFTPVSFSPNGAWDYRGDSDKENESECRARGARIVDWLRGEAIPMAQDRGVSGIATIVLCTHQTFADLLCHLLLDGSSAGWAYGDIKYPLRNASMSEIYLHPSGKATPGVLDDAKHTGLIRFRRNRR